VLDSLMFIAVYTCRDSRNVTLLELVTTREAVVSKSPKRDFHFSRRLACPKSARSFSFFPLENTTVVYLGHVWLGICYDFYNL
jgi:hypothetical protein